MQIIHHITIDLARGLPQLPLDAVQGDGNTRKILLTLLEDGKTWNVPEGVTAAVAFRKADGKKGLYDTLPDGTKAVTVTGNTVTATLAPQVLTCPGEVSAAVVFYNSALDQLATFPFAIRVKGNPAAGKEISNDYYRYSTMEQVSEAVEAALASLEAEKQEFLSKAEEALRVVHDTAAEDAPAIVCQAAGESVTVTDAAQRPLQGLSLYGKTIQKGTPTPASSVPLESVGDDGSVAVTVCGKNLVDVFNENMNVMRDGKTGTTYAHIVNADGSLTINVSGLQSYGQGFAKSLCAGQAVTISFMVDNVGNGSGLAFRIFNMNDYQNHLFYTSIKEPSKFVHTFTPTVDSKYLFCWYVGSGTYPSGAQIHDLQMEFGEVATDYEPYKDGGFVTIQTPNGLLGIPVSSGGNYIDSNGQQWICDEVDFARGVYVQRVAEVDMGKVDWRYRSQYGIFTSAELPQESVPRSKGLCSHYPVVAKSYNQLDDKELVIKDTGFSYSNYIIVRDSSYDDAETFKAAMAVAKVLHELATPIETPLSAEELAAYAALHTQKPNTTVFNDAGAGLGLAYVADTKTYIDQKLAAISAAMLNA